MAVQVLVTGKKYEGKYVALRSFGDNTVLAFGEQPKVVMEEATEKAGKSAVGPVLVFVPKDSVNSIY